MLRSSIACKIEHRYEFHSRRVATDMVCPFLVTSRQTSIAVGAKGEIPEDRSILQVSEERNAEVRKRENRRIGKDGTEAEWILVV